MSALAGSSRNVIGSSSATVSAGPMPGSTPTAVPIVTPTNAHSRLPGVIARGEAFEKQCSVSPCQNPQGPVGRLNPIKRSNTRNTMAANAQPYATVRQNFGAPSSIAAATNSAAELTT